MEQTDICATENLPYWVFLHCATWKKESPKKINWHQIQFTKPVWMIHSRIGLIWFLSSNRLNESVWAC